MKMVPRDELEFMSDAKLKLAVLVSGAGRTLQNILDVIAAGQLNAEVTLVVGSRPDLHGLRRAADAKIMNFVVDRREFENCEHFSNAVFSLCDDAGVGLVCLGGWLCLLEIPADYLLRTINIHPALLPSFGGQGMFGRKVHEAVLEHGCKISGCTVHFVDAAYDNGPIILQRACPVLEEDTADTLSQRVFEEEKIAYVEAIRLFAAGRLKIEGRRVIISPAPPR